jgi:rare lipoprotein A (peptidoglycan hydrolase)
LLRNQLTFTGTAPVSDAGRTIEIDRLGHETKWNWQPTAQATVSPQGTFAATWATDHIGEFEMRAILSGPRAQAVDASSAASSPSAPTVLVTVYRPSVASWYGGPTMWGRQTACGIKLTRQTIGLANKTLPCGTNVALYYQGKTLVVPVIDHGPYVNGRDWDLTEATATALGIGTQGVVTLGAVSLPKPPATVAMAG